MSLDKVLPMLVLTGVVAPYGGSGSVCHSAALAVIAPSSVGCADTFPPGGRQGRRGRRPLRWGRCRLPFTHPWPSSPPHPSRPLAVPPSPQGEGGAVVWRCLRDMCLRHTKKPPFGAVFRLSKKHRRFRARRREPMKSEKTDDMRVSFFTSQATKCANSAPEAHYSCA